MVAIMENTPLYDILKVNTLEVTSYHHQAIKGLSNKLLPMVKSSDELIKAIYMPNGKIYMCFAIASLIFTYIG